MKRQHKMDVTTHPIGCRLFEHSVAHQSDPQRMYWYHKNAALSSPAGVVNNTHSHVGFKYLHGYGA